MYKQISSVMRLTTIFILLTACQLYAASSFAQRFTLVRNKVPISVLFKEIKKQTGYHVLWDDDVLKGSTQINSNFKNTLLNEVLETSLKALPVTYTIHHKSIILKPKSTPSFLDRFIDLFAVIDVRGIVLDEQGNPLAGATVKVKGINKSVATNDKGEFYLQGVEEGAMLLISYLGYASQEIRAAAELGKISLSLNNDELKEVEIVSTGYQTIEKGRATGSFTLIDSALIQRKASTNILDRLEDVTSGLLFNKSKSLAAQSDFNIRGRSTINGDDKPLVIVDNFPYEGSISNLNPNDIKNITILKDAAASAVWGTRAGNGVVVISTYKGSYGVTQQLSFNSNLTLADKPDLFSAPWFSAPAWLEIEQFLFNKGAYNSAINNGYRPVSPGVYVMNQAKKKLISQADSLERINQLKAYDVRRDMLTHLYRISGNQQYALNLTGGSANNNYFISAGYDRNLASKTTDSYQRLTLTANNTYLTLKDRLEISTGLMYSNGLNKSGAAFVPGSPYDRLTEDGGSPMALATTQLSLSYVDTAGKGRLLDWHYRPLDENHPNSKSRTTNYMINLGLKYKLAAGFHAEARYQYQQQSILSEVLNTESSYMVRDLVNKLSSISALGNVQRVVPLGSIFSINNTTLRSNYGRLQMNYEKRFAGEQSLSAIGGFEIRNVFSESIAQRLYGYNESTRTNANSTIDFTKDYPYIYNKGLTERLSAGQGNSYLLDRYVSYYFNGSYSLKNNRYTLSLSARKDASNLFGVKPNQKGVPLWSAGLQWNISGEPFYEFEALPVLKLRGSYGFTGNVSKTITAFLTANTVGPNIYGSVYNQITNPPNPDLKWERIKIINVGLDFASKDNRLSGSIEPYLKYGLDLFGTSPLPGQAGQLLYQGNFANTRTKGMDITLNSVNSKGKIHWVSNALLSFNKDKVTRYTASKATNSALIKQPYDSPMEGKPYFAIYAFKWAGLDNTGEPQLYQNGVASKNYSQIANSLDRTDVEFIGSAIPTTYGSLRNTFSYQNLELSFNLSFRLNYFFRRPSLSNAAVYSGTGYQSNIDYDRRWQKAGDELHTDVPALIYPNNNQRNDAYIFSDVLVERADNIRFQDLRLAWDFSRLVRNSRGLQVYAYVNNIGYLWKANGYGIDPDKLLFSLSNVPQVTTYSIGLTAKL